MVNTTYRCDCRTFQKIHNSINKMWCIYQWNVSLKEGGSPDTSYMMKLEDTTSNEISRMQKDKYCVILLK